MSPDSAQLKPYDVSLDHAALKWAQVGPLFAQYSIPLAGTIDGIWVDCYRRASSESAEFSQFRLDPERRTISFSCRADDGPAKIQSTIKRLELLVTFVNQRARCAVPTSRAATN
jgi:hypothetical protein